MFVIKGQCALFSFKEFLKVLFSFLFVSSLLKVVVSKVTDIVFLFLVFSTWIVNPIEVFFTVTPFSRWLYSRKIELKNHLLSNKFALGEHSCIFNICASLGRTMLATILYSEVRLVLLPKVLLVIRHCQRATYTIIVVARTFAKPQQDFTTQGPCSLSIPQGNICLLLPFFFLLPLLSCIHL